MEQGTCRFGSETMAQSYKRGRLILLFLLFIFLTGCNPSPKGELVTQSDTTKEQESEDFKEKETGIAETGIFVHVSGEVNNPGLYELKAGSRIFDAVKAAGGFTEKADEDSLNLAQKLEDESKIRILSLDRKEREDGEEALEGNLADDRIDLNRATLEELMTLPGIGQKRAESILNLRERKGSFQKTEDLLEVEGIKEGIFHKIKDLIKV